MWIWGGWTEGGVKAAILSITNGVLLITYTVNYYQASQKFSYETELTKTYLLLQLSVTLCVMCCAIDGLQGLSRKGLVKVMRVRWGYVISSVQGVLSFIYISLQVGAMAPIMSYKHNLQVILGVTHFKGNLKHHTYTYTLHTHTEPTNHFSLALSRVLYRLRFFRDI